ncbi:universal stress protein [Actinospica sp. MGRD01-02]|uniref:Universal stress protein n=1 Tax=Actinospica acidithermotolerans TaxID=2828514 RepID=A0A941IME8_9ACTN|nr:universal stress protein [Actinospica acidithermotolerans]MBR7829933.1 universal stress protein [Actinospica acidithermotolerans]
MSELFTPDAYEGRPVAVAVDGSDFARDAADWAAGEALRGGRRLRVLTVADSASDEDAFDLLDEIETRLVKAHPGLVVERDALVGDPVRELEAVSRESALLVVGSRGRGGFAGLLLGSVSFHLAAHAHCPLVVVPRSHAAAAHRGPSVVGVDDEHDCTQVLRYALDHAEGAGGGLRVVHAWAPYPLHDSTYISDTDITARHAQERIAAWLKAAHAEQYRVRAETAVVRGDPAKVLVEQSRDADLVVVGAHRGRLPRTGRIGPILHELLLAARCPVAIVPLVWSAE